MIEIWKRANPSERNGLRLIIGMTLMVALFSIISQIAYYMTNGVFEYPLWRYILWLVSLGAYSRLIVFYSIRGPQLGRWAFTLRLILTGIAAALTAYLVPDGPGWLLIAPLCSDMRPQYRFPISLPLYLFLLVCMVFPIINIPFETFAIDDLIGLIAQMGVVIAFVSVFSGLQNQLANEKMKLEIAHQKLAAYAAEVEELATTRERNRLAREIHDNLGHYLTIVNVQLEAGKLLLERNPAKARAAMEKAQRLTQEGLQAVRDSVSSLRESALDKPIAEAIGALVENERVSGITAHYHQHGTPTPLGPKTTLTLYRTAQEALTNMRKHANATQVDVTLDYRSAESVRLIIRDNGSGSDNPQGGFGLIGIQERISLLDGTLEIETARGDGFQIDVQLPRSTPSNPISL